MNELKAAFFDLDGVIFDTEPQYTVFWGGECRRYHPEVPGLEHKIKGQTLDQIYGQWFAGSLAGEREAITRRLNEFERQMDYNYVDGLPPLLAELRRHGVRLAVVTSSNRAKMEAVCAKHPEFEGLFDAVLTSEDFAESKPSPDCYLTAAARFGCQPDSCVVFEDSLNGLRSGRAAKMRVVGLATTLQVSVIQPLSDVQIADYTDFRYKDLTELFKK